MREFSKKMNEALSGRGGGKDDMIQGSVGCSRKEIEDFFCTVKEKERQTV